LSRSQRVADRGNPGAGTESDCRVRRSSSRIRFRRREALPGRVDRGGTAGRHRLVANEKSRLFGHRGLLQNRFRNAFGWSRTHSRCSHPKESFAWASVRKCPRRRCVIGVRCPLSESERANLGEPLDCEIVDPAGIPTNGGFPRGLCLRGNVVRAVVEIRGVMRQHEVEVGYIDV
jgi:hypothetical protein